jgi:hypothetical protein
MAVIRCTSWTTGRPVHEVCIDKGGSQSTAVLRLPKIDGAGHYWIQVGGGQGQSNVYNQKVPADPNNNVKVQVRVDNNKENFVRYTYATCDHCESDQNFAPFSDEVGFVCN